MKQNGELIGASTPLVMIEGERSRYLVFLESLGRNDKHGRIGRFRCDCGAMCVKIVALVRSGKTRSCGCMRGKLWMHEGKACDV
jgi:hypothetical protein